MKKLLLIGLLLLPLKLYAGTTDYYNMNHFETFQSSNTNLDIMRFRGAFELYNDTSTLLMADATPYFDISSFTFVYKSTGTESVFSASIASFTVHTNASFGEFINLKSVVITISPDGATTQIVPTKSNTILTSTIAVTLSSHVAAGVASISTTSFNTGDYITVTSTATHAIQIPTGLTHYVIAESSPTIWNQWDTINFRLYGSYWVQESSSTGKQ